MEFNKPYYRESAATASPDGTYGKLDLKLQKVVKINLKQFFALIT